MHELVVDITRLLARGLEGRLPTGVDRVSLEYLRHFGDRASALVRFAGRWVILEGAEARLVFDELLAPSTHFVRLVRIGVARGYLLGWREHTRSLLLNTGHSGLDQTDYALQLGRRGMLPVFFLHDIIPLTHPEYCRAGETAKHQQRLSTMLQNGKGVIVNSEDTRDALEYFAARDQSVMPPCVVAPLAPATLPQPALCPPMDKPYFVMLGTIEPRKNHLLVLHIWRQLVEEFGDAAPRLVIIGQRGWECEQVVDLLDRCEALQGYVFEKRRCTDAELSTWLAYARALLFPSFVEGFGMPLVEALSVGVPVVASDLPVFREIVGNIPEYLDPLDGVGWKRVILEYAQSLSHTRQAQCLRLKGLHIATWKEHFDLVDSFLDQIVSVATA